MPFAECTCEFKQKLRLYQKFLFKTRKQVIYSSTRFSLNPIMLQYYGEMLE